MKYRTSTLVLLAFVATSLYGANNQSADRPVPQPRPRLLPTPAARLAINEKKPRESSVVTLDKMEVTGAKIPAAVPRRAEPEPTKFTWQYGGPLTEVIVGGRPLTIGLQAHRDLFAEDAKYQEKRAQVEFDLIRLKL